MFETLKRKEKIIEDRYVWDGIDPEKYSEILHFLFKEHPSPDSDVPFFAKYVADVLKESPASLPPIREQNTGSLTDPQALDALPSTPNQSKPHAELIELTNSLHHTATVPPTSTMSVVAEQNIISLASAIEKLAKSLQPPQPPSDSDEEGDQTIDGSTPYSVEKSLANAVFADEETLSDLQGVLETDKNLILQGVPGAGKSYLARELAQILVGAVDPYRIRSVQFHPSTGYEDFVRGWRPTHSGRMELVDGVFLKLVHDAHKHFEEAGKDEATAPKFVCIIDEINRGNPSHIFGEMLTLIEASKRSVDHALCLSYPRHLTERISLPPNLYIIGTMNITDRSLALVDHAFRRRFHFETLQPTLGPVWLRAQL